MENTTEKREEINIENVSAGKVHKILDRPVLSAILLLVFALVMSSLVQLPRYVIWGANANGTAQHLYDVATALLLLVITEFIYTKVWFKGEFEGTLKGDIRNGFRIMIPVIVVDVALFIFDSIVAGGSMNSLVFVFATSLVAGIVEEITFRSLILANLMRITKTYKGMLMSVVVTSVIFGVAHLTNLISGANAGSTIMQVISASIMGLFFAAVYMMCGSIVPLMVFHFGHDVLAFLFLKVNESGATIRGVTTVSLIEELILNIALLVMAVYILRPVNFEQIRRKWDEKWAQGQA